MRLPSLPIYIDEFPTGSSSAGCSRALFILTHFHTDHMKGLSSGWSTGVILTSHPTKQLLLSKFEGLRGRVLGFPLWCRTPVLAPACPPSSSSAHPRVFVTLLPSFHIPGSVMVYLETPSGLTYLHTGDFRFCEAARQSPLQPFFTTHRVDHLFLDDTWLHLGHVEMTQRLPWETPDTTAPNTAGGRAVESGMRVLSKLLNSEQVEEAVEAIGRRMDHQRQLFRHWLRAQPPQEEQEQDAVRLPNSVPRAENSQASSGECSPATGVRQPFVVRVYLHNQFGKELLIQQLAMRLRTRALIDDLRYARLLTVAETLEEERDDLSAFAAPSAHSSAILPHEGSRASSPEGLVSAPLSPDEAAWRAAGGEAALYPLNLNCFTAFSHARSSWHDDDDTAATAAIGLKLSKPEPPLIEVVSTRAAIAPAALQAAADARGGTPYYGVVISGWARLQSQRRQDGPNNDSSSANSGQVWHIPTTLHSTPQEIIDFVAMLRPLSVTPLHYRPSRGAVVMQRLGPYLRTPFVNHHDTGLALNCDNGSGSSAGAVDRWRVFLPAHVMQQDSETSAVLTLSTSGANHSARTHDSSEDSGLDALAPQPHRGFRIGPPSRVCLTEPSLSTVGTHPHGCPASSSSFSAAASVSAQTPPSCVPSQISEPLTKGAKSAVKTHSDELMPSWRLRSLTQSYLSANSHSSSGRTSMIKRERSSESATVMTSNAAYTRSRREEYPLSMILPTTRFKAEPEEEETKAAAVDQMGSLRGALSLSDIADELL